MVVIEMIYNTNNPGAVDPFTLHLLLEKEIDVVLPNGDLANAVLLDVEPLEMEGLFSLILSLEDEYFSALSPFPDVSLN